MTFQPQPEIVFGARLAGGAASARPASSAAARPMAMIFMVSLPCRQTGVSPATVVLCITRRWPS
jgi:hypothetical protein